MNLQDIILAMSEVYNQTLSKHSAMQSVAEDVEYENVSETGLESKTTSTELAQTDSVINQEVAPKKQPLNNPLTG